VRDLPIGDGAWISLIVREGVPIQPRGSSKVVPGDEVLVLTDPEDEAALRRVFEG
jgi:Trk K+ transport system NAD-binding subunit